MSKTLVPRINGGKYDVNILKNNNIYLNKNGEYIWVGKLKYITDHIGAYDNLHLNLNGYMSLYYDKDVSSTASSTKNASGKKKRKSKSNKKRKTRKSK